MKLEKLTCNSCGAPISVPVQANFVRCNHCGGQLAVHRTEDVTFTEKLELLYESTELYEPTQGFNDRLVNISAHAELAALDREWDLERENYMVKDQHGARYIPTKVGSLSKGLATTVFGCFWTMFALALSYGQPGLGLVFPGVGVVFVVASVVISVSRYNKAEAFQRAQQRYNALRRELLLNTGSFHLS